MEFNKHVLDIDPAAETDRLVNLLRTSVRQELRRYGAVVGVSGGVDSATVLALCARAFGPKRVVAVMMPEKDSDTESEKLARELADRFKVETVLLENITHALEGFGCYPRRDEAIARIFPEYDPDAGYKAKIVLPSNILEDSTLNVFSVAIITPDGEEKSERLPVRELLQIVAASNFKQRSRMAMLYYHAESRNYAVIGTSNRNEHDQGFLVKYGDSGVDIQLIAHLCKTQVYQLAEHLDVPEEIRQRTPTSDTYSAHQTQEEFFFRIPFELMDLLQYAQENDVSISRAAEVMNLAEEQVQRVFDDFTRKHRTTEYIRTPPIVFEMSRTN